jgi:hypothetical protein
MARSFQTNDGYRLYPVGGVWVDNLDPAGVDMTFDSGPDGLPVDDQGQPLDGIPIEVWAGETTHE